MSRQLTTPDDNPDRSFNVPEPWLKRRQIAEHCGFSVRWVERQTASGLPGRKLGGEYR